MAEWIPVGHFVVEADVIRWKEGVFNYRRRKKAKPQLLGERLVTAEVMKVDDQGWIILQVRLCEVVSVGWNVREVPVLPKGAEIKRKRTTVTRGNAERVRWREEDVRSILASKFVGIRD